MALLQFVEFFKCQRVNWSHEAQFAFEITGTRWRSDAFRKFGHFSGFGHCRLNIKVTTQSFDCCFKTHLDFGFFNFRTT